MSRIILVMTIVCTLGAHLAAEESLTGTKPIQSYTLPFPGKESRCFFYYDGSLYVCNFPERLLYNTAGGSTLRLAEDMKGWYILDAVMIGERIVYCSRDRVLFREGENVRTVQIPGTKDLFSITTDGSRIYLLDTDEASKTTSIVRTNDRFEVEARVVFSGEPRDIVWYDGFLWIFRRTDRCIYKLAVKTLEPLVRIQSGVEHSYTNGIVFIDGRLYVHDRETSELKLIEWAEKGPMTLSLPRTVTYTFVNESRNESDESETSARFRVPVPPDLPWQKLVSITWQNAPDRIESDRFGQKLAIFENVKIPPNRKHTLSYTATVGISTVSFLLPELPLSELKKIPKEIASVYLGDAEKFDMKNPLVIKEAKNAALNSDKTRPTGIRQMIENITAHIIAHYEYDMDDDWETTGTVWKRGTGSCSEYSFTLSAFMRLNGIPTRLVGGVNVPDKQADDRFHRWTEIWYPGTGWVPVDATRIDSDEPDSYDYDFLFGHSGYTITLSNEGDTGEGGLGTHYYIDRHYTGGKRDRTAYANKVTDSNDIRNTVTLTVAETAP